MGRLSTRGPPIELVRLVIAPAGAGLILRGSFGLERNNLLPGFGKGGATMRPGTGSPHSELELRASFSDCRRTASAVAGVGTCAPKCLPTPVPRALNSLWALPLASVCWSRPQRACLSSQAAKSLASFGNFGMSRRIAPKLLRRPRARRPFVQRSICSRIVVSHSRRQSTASSSLSKRSMSTSLSGLTTLASRISHSKRFL